MKRVLCLLSNMNAGGAETFLMKLYRKIDKAKFQMDFCINVEEKCFYEDEINSLGGKIYRIPSRSANLRKHIKGLNKIIISNSYQYVLQVASHPVGFVDMWVAKKCNVKVCSFRSSNSDDGGSVFHRIVNTLCRVTLSRYIDVKIAPSDLAAEFTFGKNEYEKGKVSILHNGVELNDYEFKEEKREIIRRELGIDNEYVIGHIGRFNSQKNHRFLIEIFNEFLKVNSCSKLVLVGNGTLEEDIIKYVNKMGIQDKVIFTGVRKDIGAILSAMDVFVFPSLYEGMPNTVIEAQANGLKCIVSDTITKEANITGNVSYIPLNNNPEEWANQIASQMNVKRQNVREAFLDNFYDIDSCAERFVSLVFKE